MSTHPLVPRGLCTSGSVPGILHGLLKMHESNRPSGPTSLVIGTHNNVAKLLVSLLQPCTTKSYSSVEDSFSFVSKISSLILPLAVSWRALELAVFSIIKLFKNVLVFAVFSLYKVLISQHTIIALSIVTSLNRFLILPSRKTTLCLIGNCKIRLIEFLWGWPSDFPRHYLIPCAALRNISSPIPPLLETHLMSVLC